MDVPSCDTPSPLPFVPPLALPAAETAERDALLAQYDLDGDGRVTWEELVDTLLHSYPVVDTDQSFCFDDRQQIPCPESGQPWFGQDAQYAGPVPRYLDNGDGTVTDLNTGLMWQQDPGPKHSYAEAQGGAATLSLGGYTDWRLPTIKELYSLILFSGLDVSPCMVNTDECAGIPFLDTDYFVFQYGDTSVGERIIDAQYWSATEYLSTTINGDATVFGVNFADGRIKGYPREQRPDGSIPTEFVRYVRGNPSYGRNDLVDNGDSTITDQATGLIWMQQDSGIVLDWQGALDYCAFNRLNGHDD